MSRPRIGYTARNFSFDFLHLAIEFSIRISGGRPVRLTPNSPKYDTPIKGLVIGGGTDLYPALFENAPKPNYVYDQARDDMELKWLKQAEKNSLPILGICRGAQLLNVCRGGSLHIDISKVYENAKYPAHFLAYLFFRKQIALEPDTLLHRILKSNHSLVNSMHSQAVDQVGDGLIVSAREDNGVVQAIEDPSAPFCLGVQFHPEVLIHRAKFRNIFKALVESARDIRVDA